MPKPERLWQLTTLILAVALFAAFALLHQATTVMQPPPDTLPTVSSATNLERLTISPNARRVLERYAL